MFGISGAELVTIAIIAVVIAGPERLPAYAQRLGQFIADARRQLQALRKEHSVDDILEESGINDIKNDFDSLRDRMR